MLCRRTGAQRSVEGLALYSAAARYAPLPVLRPDPEVVAKPQRRSYSAEYKLRILREVGATAVTRGAVGALLRREGSVLLAAGRLAKRTSPGDAGVLDSAEARTQVQAQSHGRGNVKAAASECAPQRRAAQGPHYHRRRKKSGRTVGLCSGRRSQDHEGVNLLGTPLTKSI